MKRSSVDVKALIVLGLFSLALIAYVIAGVTQGHAVEHEDIVLDCSDETMIQAITAPDRALGVTARIAEDEARNSVDDEQDGEYTDDYTDYCVSDGTYYAEYNDLYNDNGPSRSMPGWYDGYLETYYSSNTMYHYRTDEWTVDDEGFYRDDQGRYIVGVDIAEGIEIGTEVETGKGTGVVMDYGSGAHVHDFYTNW